MVTMHSLAAAPEAAEAADPVQKASWLAGRAVVGDCTAPAY